MFKRSLRIKVMAAMFSAAFLFGVDRVDAYTYSNGTFELERIAEDDNELVITNNAYIISTEIVNPHIITSSKVNYDSCKLQVNAADNGNDAQTLITGLPRNPTSEMINSIKQVIEKTDWYKLIEEADTGDEEVTLTEPFKALNSQYGLDLKYESSLLWGGTDEGGDSDLDWLIISNIDFSNGKWTTLCKDAETTIVINTTSEAIGTIKTDSPITVSNESRLYAQKGILTSKTINITTNSKVSSGTNGVNAKSLLVDGDVMVYNPEIADYYDGSTTFLISGSNIKITDLLKAKGKILVTYFGSINAGTIESTSGDIVTSTDSEKNVISGTITANGTIKGNALNVGVINATSATITGNQSINGIFTITGQAKLNGGAALGGKKITGLSIGTLSASSTDAVNGKQLYTAMQSSGKTYTAGSDISISSANAISVAKAGKVVSGNTGIMTGDAVYQETSKIDSTFKSHNASITSNNSKLDNLTTSIESLRKSLGTINSSVSDAISGLPGSLANFANKDLTDLSDTGINTLKSYIKSEIKKQIPSNSKTASYAIEATVTKDTSAIDNVIASKANASDLNALGNKVDGKADKADVSSFEDTVNAKAELSYVNDGLAKKADQSVIEAVSSDVDRNTSAIAKNTDLIQSNTEAISELNDSKADVSGSNIDVSSWTNKLGTGTVAKDDSDLVTGSSVASALDKKADIGYVAMGLGSMESGLDQMSQQVIKDVSRVGAGASALMGLHPTGDKFEFATAYGHYKNSNNTALGVFYKPSANSTVSMAGTIGDGDTMLSAGVSIKLGLNKEVKKVITPEEFGKMKSAVDSQDEKLDQMEKTLQQLMAR